MKTKTKNQEQKAIASELRKGDMVMVISGGNKKKRPNKGQTGKIIGFIGKKKDRVLIEGVNMHVKHMRQSSPDKPAGKISKEAGIHVSNVMFYVEKHSKPVRLKHKFLDDGKKVRGYLDPESKNFVEIEA